MVLKKSHRDIFECLISGGVLINGKVKEGRPAQTWLSYGKSEVTRVSPTTVHSLIKKGLLQKVDDLLTTETFTISDKGRETLRKG